MMFYNPMFGDPLYLLVMIVGAALVFLPQMWVKNTYKHFKEVQNRNGLSGAEIARDILSRQNVHDVVVEMTPGELSDHYDPGSKKVRLSQEIYQGRSIASAAIAAHEVGHALQHATGYVPVTIRSALVPAVNFGTSLGPLMLLAAFMIGFTSEMIPEWAWLMAWVGVALFGMGVVFHVVTLPVEIDASMRAVKILSSGHYLTQTEVPQAKKVLTSAAFTYVAAAMYALIQLLYYVFRLTGMRTSRE